MMHTAGLALLLIFALLAPASAQTTSSTTGGIGSGTSRNDGAVSLPRVQNSSTITTGTTAAGTTTITTGTTTGTTATGGAAGATSSGTGAGGSTSSTSGGTGRGAGGARTGSATSSRSSGSQGGGHWVVCPPSGGGLAPLFTGMDLSCAPD